MPDPRFTHPEETLARLLSLLPPAPDAWVEAAASLPRTRRDADGIVALAETDLEFRAAVIADLESALRAAGYEPNRSLVAVVRQRLADEGG
jgi:hypothetical protein